MVLAAIVGAAGLGSSAQAATCPNVAFRIGPSASLPDCRAYEHVSPVSKQGSHAFAVAISDDGNHAVFLSHNAQDGDQDPDKLAGGSYYSASRSSAGWSSTALSPPLSDDTTLPTVKNVQAFTPDLREALLEYLQGASVSSQIGGASGYRLFIRDPDGTLHAASPLLAPPTVPATGFPSLTVIPSRDFSHIVGTTSLAPLQVTSGPADPVAGIGNHLYEVFGATTDSPGLRLVTIEPDGTPFPSGGTLGGPSLPATSNFNAVSADGSRIFFTAAMTGGVASVWARTDGSSTTDISEPSPNPQCTTTACSGATPAAASFQGASADGSKVFFTTNQPLVDGDTDTTTDLYEYDFSQPAGENLIQVSAGDATDPTPGAGAGVLGVVRISDDGSHVYFTATGVLTTATNAAGQSAQQGADNLYVYERDAANPQGRTEFVADLCSAAGKSGSVAVSNCPGSGSDATLWGADSARQAQATPDGRFLVFTTFGQLAPDDSDTAQDVYLYDSASGDITWLSHGEAGDESAGDDSAFNASIQAPNYVATAGFLPVEQSTRALSDDGSTVVFTTAEGLSPSDVNGATDLYEWHDGQVALLSDGTATTGLPNVGVGVVTPSGGDVLFSSAAALTPDDSDGGLSDVYDARVDGGFPFTPPAAPCASSDVCQGPAAGGLAATIAGTATFTGPGNAVPAAATGPAVTHKAKVTTGKVKVSRKTVEGSRFSLGVKLPGKGKVTVTGASVAKMSKAVGKAGSVKLTVKLTKPAQRALRRKRRMKIHVKVAFKPAAGKPSSVSVPVTVKA